MMAHTEAPTREIAGAVLVTGASSGLGRHFATMLARRGMTVVVAARRRADLATLVDAIEADGGKVWAVEMDVTDVDSVRRAHVRAVELVGRLSGLVNNAGVTETVPVLDQDELSWDRIMDTNLKGCWAVARESARHMAAHGGGAIVNIASILGLRQGGQLTAYATSKAAVIQLTKQLALELARHQIRVNALAPGYIGTDLNDTFFRSAAGEAMIKRIPLRRLGRLEDLDAPLRLLLSSESAYMTGSVIAVDGGHLVTGL